LLPRRRRLAQWRYTPAASGWLQACCDVLAAGLPRVAPEAVARCLLYLAGAGHQLPRTQLRLMLLRLYQCFGSMDVGTLAATAHAAAQWSRVGLPEARWTKALMGAVVARVEDVDVGAAAALLQALAVLQPAGAQGLCAALEQQCCWALGAASGDDCCQLLHGFALLGHQPQPMLAQQLLNRLQARLHELSPGGVAAALSNLAVLEWQPPGSWVEAALDHVTMHVQECEVDDLLRLLRGVKGLGYSVSGDRMRTLVGRFQQLLQGAEPGSSMGGDGNWEVRQLLGLQ
jgi:hypothetical protein